MINEMNMNEPEKLKEVVREKYAGIVFQESNCCSKTKTKDSEYSVFNESYENLKGYEKDADLNLGCGVPTKHAAMKPGDAVLDLGSGAGNDCFVARAIVGENGRVTGLDFTNEMVEKARINNKKLGYSNVDFIKGDIENIPLGDDLYDVVISNCVLNLVPDKKQSFSEIKRVLKSAGHFCVSDIVLQGDLPETIRNASAMYAGCVSGALQKEDYIDIIKSTGFKSIEIKKERQIQVPDELLLEYVSQEELEFYKKSGGGIFSITVVGQK